MPTKSTAASETIRVPGLESVDRLTLGATIAVFVRGMEAFTRARGTVTVSAVDGSTAEARIIGSEAGRLYGMAARFMAQSPAASVAMMQNGGSSYSDIAFFEALENVYEDAQAVHPLEPYTVLLVTRAA